MKPNHFKFYEATISGKIDLPYILDEIFNREKSNFIGNRWDESPGKIACTISIMESGKSIEDLVAFPFIHENGEVRFKMTQGQTRYVLLNIFKNMSFRIIIIDTFHIGIDKIKAVFPDVKECYDRFPADLQYSRSHKAHKFKLIYGNETGVERGIAIMKDMKEQYQEWVKTKPVLRFYHNDKLKYKWGLYESNGVIDHHIDNVVDAYKILLKHLDII